MGNDFETVPERRPSDAGLTAGARLGKYRLERMIGSGGMGMVWEAVDVELHRHVALKFMGSELAGASIARARLMREARAMARLRHANVVGVFDVETLEGRDVIAMELVEGETLDTWLGSCHPKHEIVRMLVAAGRGLAAAHDAGVVHRDFKPQNVLVDRRGRPLVTDFGLARAVGEADEPAHAHAIGALDTPLTLTGAVMGTPAYMAPEQLEGAPADERADQFAFCATLWEALAGTRPFPGDSVEEIARSLTRGTPRHGDRVPRRLRALLVRGLASTPAARWPSMTSLLDAIERGWRRPLRIALAAAALAVLGVAVFVALRAFSHRTPWAPKIVDLPQYEENSDSVAFSPDGTQLAFTSDRDRQDWSRIYLVPVAGGEPRAITPAEDSYESVRWGRDGTSLIAMKWTEQGYHATRIPLLAGRPFEDFGVALGADDCGDAIALVEADASEGRLVLRHRDGRRDVLLRSAKEWILTPRCDPSGRRISVTRSVAVAQDKASGNLVVVDRAGHETTLTTGHRSSNGAWTRDGRSIVFSQLGRDNAVLLYEIPATGGKIRQLTFDNGPHIGADVSPDGRTLIFNRDHRTRVPVVGRDGEVRRLIARRAVFNRPLPTADPNRIVVERISEGANSGDVVVIDTRDGSERTLVANALYPGVSNDGKRVFFQALVPPPRLFAISLDGGPIETVATLPGSLYDIHDGPDGQHVMVHPEDRPVEFWHVRVDRTLVKEPIQALVIPAPAGGWRAILMPNEAVATFRIVAPDGTEQRRIEADVTRVTWLDDHRLAYYARAKFHIVDVTTGTELATLPGPSWSGQAVLGRDGVQWYDIQSTGHVTRHAIANFGDRPK